MVGAIALFPHLRSDQGPRFVAVIGKALKLPIPENTLHTQAANTFQSIPHRALYESCSPPLQPIPKEKVLADTHEWEEFVSQYTLDPKKK